MLSNGQIIIAKPYQEDDTADLDNDDNVSQEEKHVTIPTDIKAHILTYIQLDEQIESKKEAIKKLNKEIKDIKQKNKSHEDFVIKFLVDTGENIINLDSRNETITKTTTKTKGAIKPDYIKNTLMELLKVNDEVTNNVLAQIEQQRKITTKETLTRTKV